MSKEEKFWMVFLLGLMLLGMLTGCRTKYVTVPESHDVYVSIHDTLEYHDSIYQKDSVYMWVQGDTIWKEKVTIKYRDRIIGKTIYRDSIRVDSIRVPYPYPVEKKLNLWDRTVLAVAKPLIALAVILFIIWWIVRIRR